MLFTIQPSKLKKNKAIALGVRNTSECRSTVMEVGRLCLNILSKDIICVVSKILIKQLSYMI